MEGKYYTPDISEFYVGFEYEIKDFAFDKATEYSRSVEEVERNKFDIIRHLEKSELSANTKRGVQYWNTRQDRDLIITESLPSICRVKYLDKDDIKSFGFVEDVHNGVICYRLGNYILFWFGTPMISIDYFTTDGKELQFFRGTIKNKSELKKLLEQLNIK